MVVCILEDIRRGRWEFSDHLEDVSSRETVFVIAPNTSPVILGSVSGFLVFREAEHVLESEAQVQDIPSSSFCF